MAEIVRLDVKVTEETAEESISQILDVIRPTWKRGTYEISVLVGGLVNKIWKVTGSAQQDDVLLVKMYGEGTEEYFDRKMEFKIMEVLHHEGLLMPIHCKFSNGIMYKYAEGARLTCEQLMDPKCSRLLFKLLHKIHKVEIKEKTGEKVPDSIIVQGEVVAVYRAADLSEIEKLERYKAHVPPKEDLLKDLETMFSWNEELKKEFPEVFVHGDPHRFNIAYDPTKEQLALLDWECSGFGCELNDIASHICRDADFKMTDMGIDLINDKPFLTAFVRLYLETHPSYADEEVSNTLVGTWLCGLYKAIYVSSIILVPWSLCQIARNPLGFDFMRVAIITYKQAKDARAHYEEMQSIQTD